MQTKSTLLFILAMAFVPLAGCQGGGDAVPMASPVTIVNQFAGDDAAFKSMGCQIVNSAAELQAIGSAALAEKEIDFDNHSLIIVTVGEQAAAGFWVKITGVQRGGGEVYVQATVNQPEEGAVEADNPTHAYAAAVVSRVTGTAVLEPKSVTGQAP